MQVCLLITSALFIAFPFLEMAEKMCCKHSSDRRDKSGHSGQEK